MEELSMQQIIRGSFSGQLDNSMTYIHLLIQAGAVLIAGIVLWRASVIFSQPQKSTTKHRRTF